MIYHFLTEILFIIGGAYIGSNFYYKRWWNAMFGFGFTLLLFILQYNEVI